MTNITKKYLLLGCIFVGAGLSACQGAPIVDDKTPLGSKIVRMGDTVVADVEGTNIFLSDIEHAALAKNAIKPGQSLTPKDPMFQSILDELIDQRLLALEALKRSLDQTDETRRRLTVARERILANVVIENLLAEKVTDESVKRMYKAQQALRGNGEQVRARQIVVNSEEKALELKDLVENGGNFSVLAKEFSMDDSTRDLGGDLGYFSQNAMEEMIASTAFALETGEVSAPFKSKYGWHILTTTARRAMPQPSLKTIRPEIVNIMTYDEIQKLLISLRENGDIKLRTGTKPSPSTSNLNPNIKPNNESKDEP